MTKTIRILLVDDSHHFLEAARDFLGYQESVTVVGTAMEGEEALAKSQTLQPDIILLDLNLSQSSGLKLIPVLKQNLPGTKIIVLTMMEESSYRAAALGAGADGFVHKSSMSKTLTTAILDAMQSNRKHAAPANGNSEAHKGEARLMRLAEHLPDLIYRYEFKPTRGFTYVSPSATVVTGYTPEDHYNDPDLGFKLVHPQDRHLLEAAAQGGNDPTNPLVLRWVRRDGSIVWTEQRNVSIFNEEGELTAIEGIARDITERKHTEEALKATEERFRTLVEYSSDEISILSVNGELLYESPAVNPTLGYEYGEFQGRNLFQLLHPDDRGRVQGQFAALLQDPSQHACDQFRLRHRDGSWRWVEAVGTNLLSKPSVGGIVINYHDITERKQAEEKLIQSENRYRMATQATDDVIWEWDPQTNEVEWTENAQRVFGYDLEEVERDESWWDERIHPDDRLRVNTGLAQARVSDASTWSDEYRFLCKDGTYACLSDRAFIERDAEGNVLRMVGAIADITGRKQAEEDLRQSEERFRSYIQQANDFIFTLDPAGRITSANQAMCDALGYREVELTGMSALELVTPGHQAEVAQTLQKIWDGTGIDGLEVPILTREGNTIIVHIRGRSIYKDERLLETLHIGRDVTHQIQAGEQLERRVAELEALYQSGIAFNQSFDQKEIGEKIIEVLSGRLNWHHASVRVRLGESREVELLAFNQPSEDRTSVV